MADIHKDSVIAGNLSLLTSRMYSDITIHCGLDEYKLHRAIICPRSKFFAAACKGDFMEAKIATITMNDDDPLTVKRMVFYLYTLDYPDHEAPNITVEHVVMAPMPPPHLQNKTSMAMEGVKDLSANLGLFEGAATHDPGMMNNVLVYAIAEKYDIPDLKALAKRKFQNLAESKWPHDEFHVVAEAVFSTTPDGDTGLRQVVLDICKEHFQEILKDEESRMGFLDNHSIAAVVAIAAVQRIDHLEVGLDDALAKQTAKEQDLSNSKTDADRALVQLSGELSKAKADMQEALNQNDALVSRISALFQNVGDLWECRHCHDGFNCYPECLWTPGKFNMQIRCMNCQTRHVL